MFQRWKGRFVPDQLRDQLFAFSLSLRKNSNRFPWKSFVPDFSGDVDNASLEVAELG